MRSEARRGEQGQSGGRRKRFAPQVSHALQAGRCRIVDESSLMGAGARHCRKCNRGKGRAFALERASLPGSEAIRKRLGRVPGQIGGGNREKSGDDGSALKAASCSLCV